MRLAREIQISQRLKKPCRFTCPEAPLPDFERSTQRVAHTSELEEARIELAELLAGEGVNASAGSTPCASLSESPGKLLQRESHGQGRLHDPDPLERLRGIATLTTRATRKLR